MVEEGEVAPAFTLADAAGRKVSLEDFWGKTVVLYFYPKDDTPGCTVEAIDFTKRKGELEKLGAMVIGISKDSCESHIGFMKKYGLSVILLSDPDSEVQKKYDVWKLKNTMGKEYFGTERSTFLIDESGKIVKIWRKVIPLGHADEVLKEIKKGG